MFSALGCEIARLQPNDKPIFFKGLKNRQQHRLWLKTTTPGYNAA
jgi:hypothetical protein